MSKINLSPDGARYLKMGAGLRAPWPFQLRWLVPWLCRNEITRWQKMSTASVLGASLAVGVLAGLRLESWWAVAVGFAVFVTLPMTGLNVRLPVLVDAPGQLVAASCAIATLLITEGSAPPLAMAILAVLLAWLAGATRETAPVWAAVWCWNPLPLVGLAVPLLTRLIVTPGDDAKGLEKLADTLTHPFRSALDAHRGHWMDPWLLLLPWGPLVVALYDPSLEVGVALVLGYGQLLMATDSVRLYQWAAPTLLIASLVVLPMSWWLVFTAAAVCWPWKGNGV